MLLKNTENLCTLRLGGAYITSVKNIMLYMLSKHRSMYKSGITRESELKSFRICKLQRRK